MDDTERYKLIKEAEVGEKYKHAYEECVKPFVDNKIAELFEAFKEADSSNLSHLQMIKMQSNALKSMEEEFNHFITTGKLALTVLNEEKPHE